MFIIKKVILNIIKSFLENGDKVYLYKLNKLTFIFFESN